MIIDCYVHGKQPVNLEDKCALCERDTITVEDIRKINDEEAHSWVLGTLLTMYDELRESFRDFERDGALAVAPCHGCGNSIIASHCYDCMNKLSETS